jgi:hypothetical protein
MLGEYAAAIRYFTHVITYVGFIISLGVPL